MTTSHLSVGCFGKLPHFGDFVKHNASSREIQAFDQWLQQGILTAKAQLRERWNAAYDGAPAYQFLFCAEGCEHMLAGTFLPSHDKSERKYPFFVSIYLDRNLFRPSYLALAPAIFAPLFAPARQLMRDLLHCMDMREIVARMENLSAPSAETLDREAEQHHEYLAATTCEKFWQRLFGDFANPRKYLLFKNLSEILLPYREGDPSRLTLGLRFPLGTNTESMGHDAAFWLQVCSRLLKNPELTPVAFWTAPDPGQRAYLFLFFRPPAAKNFVQLVQPDLPSDIICELEEEGKDKLDIASAALPAPYHQLLETPAMRLQEVLMRLYDLVD